MRTNEALVGVSFRLWLFTVELNMSSKATKCIYCGRFFNPTKGQGDHALTLRVFGEFQGDKTFRRACRRCNNAFGRNEQQLSQSGPLGFYRAIVRPNLGKRKRRGSYRQLGALGAPPPKCNMRFEDQSLIVKPSPQDPRDAEPLDQLVILDEGGNEHHIRLFKEMTVESLGTCVSLRAPR